VPSEPGLRLPEMLAAARDGRIRSLFIMGEDIAQTDPHSDQVRAALGALEFLVVQELFLSETAALAHVVLPAAGPLEKDGTYTNGERRIQRVRRAVSPPDGARADWEILTSLMAAGGMPQAFQSPADVMDEIARVTPGFAGVSYARLEGDGLQWPVADAHHPGTPILHEREFASGRGRLHAIDYVPSPEQGGPLTLTTGRVLAHYNAGTMTRRTPSVVLVPEDRLEMHPRDAEARGIRNGDPVRITNARASIRARADVTDRIAQGAVFLSFHFPETGTNALTSDVCDRVTGCPEYKLAAVEVSRVERTP
jgi:formate dehydrogenase major subunit